MSALDGMRYAVLDTELTSLDARSNRLLSVGAIAMDGAKIRFAGQFYRVVNPQVLVPAPGVLVHGLRPCDVEGGDTPAQAIADLEAFIGDAVVVGHFVAIDLKAIRKEGARKYEAIDTARVHRWLARHSAESVHGIENLDLPSVARAHGLDPGEQHHALHDAFLTARLWQRLIHELQQAGIHDLAAALKIGKA